MEMAPAAAPSWRDPAVFGRTIVDLAWCSSWLEAQLFERISAALSKSDARVVGAARGAGGASVPAFRSDERERVETCFNQILGRAPVIADPIGQAFLVFVHLLYLQPFAP